MKINYRCILYLAFRGFAKFIWNAFAQNDAVLRLNIRRRIAVYVFNIFAVQ